MPYILNTYPQMLEVDYTEREELLYPKIKTENKDYKKEIVFENGESKEVITTNTTIFYDTEVYRAFKKENVGNSRRMEIQNNFVPLFI